MSTAAEPARRRVFIETFGCQMNERDSRALGARLREAGYDAAATAEEADVILLNTCSVRDRAEHKVHSRLGVLRALKERRPDLVLGVGGCVAQQLGGSLLDRVDHLDLVFGPHQLGRVPELVRQVEDEGARVLAVDFDRDWERVLGQAEAPAPGGAQAFVAVQRGCDRFCTFCIVPLTQGRETSRPADAVVAEVERLVAGGVAEVTLVGQDITSYGRKDPGEPGLGGLLRRVHAVPGLERLRFITSHPAEVDAELIEAFRDLPRLASHLHLPVQSGSDRVLAGMRRGYDRAQYERVIERVREARPGVALYTDLIVGFPGERDEDFRETLSLVRSVRFDGAYCFAYSPRPGTLAARGKFPGAAGATAEQLAVPAAEASARLAELMRVQEEVGRARNERFVGTEVEVLVERDNPLVEGEVTGRASTYQPVHFPADLAETAGRIVPVRVDRAGAHFLRGVATGRGERPAPPRRPGAGLPTAPSWSAPI